MGDPIAKRQTPEDRPLVSAEEVAIMLSSHIESLQDCILHILFSSGDLVPFGRAKRSKVKPRGRQAQNWLAGAALAYAREMTPSFKLALYLKM